MRGVKVFTIIIFSCFHAYAQEETFVTTPNQMISFLNPSMTGFNDMAFSYFQQIRSSSDFLFIGEFAIKNTNSYHLRSLRKEDSYEYQRYEDRRGFILRKGNRHGLGIIGAHQTIDVKELGTIKLNYSRHLKISETFNFALGKSIGIMNASMKSEGISDRNFVLDGGMVVYGKPFVLGYSVKNLLFTQLNSEDQPNFYKGLKQQRLYLGMRHFLSYPFITETFFSLVNEDGAGTEMEIGWTLEYDELLTLGLYLNDSQSIAGQIGFRIYKDIQVFYTFDTQKHVADSRQEFHVLMRRNK